VAAARRSERVTYDIVDGRAILVDIRGTELLTLNPVGTIVWEALDGQRDVGELVEHLVERLDQVEPVQARVDVASFLAELRKLGLATE
jgi:hypothetical protein